MEITVKELINMVNIVIQGKVLPQEKLAEVTTGCAKMYGAHQVEIPQLIKEVECEISFSMEVGVKVG